MIEKESIRSLPGNTSKPALPPATTSITATFLPKESWSGHIRHRFDRLARSSPARLTLAVFAGIISLITLGLMLPFATASRNSADFIDALFTATSAVCVTGLTTVNTGIYWSTFGQVIILLGIAVGGLGVMTLASILALAVSRHLGLTQRMLAANETKTDRLGEVGSLIKAVIAASLVAESLLFAVFFPRFLTLGENIGDAIWHALFMSLSTFNNAGFVVLPEGMQAYTGDWWMVAPIIVGTIAGAVGFPVILDISGNLRSPRKWSLHTKLTLSTYFLLIAIGVLFIGLSEWWNPKTFGSMTLSETTLSLLLMGVNSRSSGLTTVNIADMTSSTWFLQDIFMFIGGGSASTAGGIKVTTLAVMALAIIAEARGDRDIETFGRRIPIATVRLAVAVTAVGAFLVTVATFILLRITSYSLDVILYEVISAFATVGLSTGITPDLPDAGKYLLTLLMFTGRTGTMTLAAAMALREKNRVIRMPEERPAIG